MSLLKYLIIQKVSMNSESLIQYVEKARKTSVKKYTIRYTEHAQTNEQIILNFFVKIIIQWKKHINS
jgi:hypothetical protein